MSLHAEELSEKLAGEAIRRGELVAFPTETVYGLGANAFDAAAVERIFKVKGRPWASPLIVHVADVEMARAVVSEWPPAAAQIADRYWPGPVTLVLPKNPQIPGVVTAGLHTVGVRIPAHPVALGLIRSAGVPIAAPSANPFMAVSPTTAEHVRQGLGDQVAMVLDGGATTVGIESTVVALHRSPPEILRLGMVTQQQLEAATGLQFMQPKALPELVEHLGDESPGQHQRHYAPRTPLYVLPADATLPAGRGCIIEMPGEPAAFAARLYAELHRADREGWEWLVIRQPPDAPEWAGIHDRLWRASTR